MKKKEIMSILDRSIDSSSLNIISKTAYDYEDTNSNSVSVGINASQSITNNPTCWGYWTEYYYPEIIRQSYPVYIQEQSKDKGKQAFELIKVLSDKKFIKLEKVKDFIDLMDTLIKIL